MGAHTASHVANLQKDHCERIVRDGVLKVIEALATASRFPSTARVSIEEARKALDDMAPAADLLAPGRHDDPEYRQMEGEARERFHAEQRREPA